MNTYAAFLVNVLHFLNGYTQASNRMESSLMAQTVLILGPTGRFGRNCAAAFETAGWRVRRFRRGDDLHRAAQGVDVIVNAWNPAYTDWAAQVPGLTKQVISAARLSGATVILPGNVYVFGQETPAPWGRGSPHAARNPLGRIRIEMEAAYREAGVRTIVLRAGDYLDTCASGNWFDKIMTTKLGRGTFTYPGAPDIPHAWAYLPDVARAAVALAAQRSNLPSFVDVPFAGYTLSGSELCGALGDVTGRGLRLKRMSWVPIRAIAPFWPMGRCILEMRYLWDTPHWLDDAPFKALQPDFRATPLRTALASAIPAPLIQRQIDPDEAMTARA